LFLEDSVFLAQILDRSLLVLADPASENGEEELPWLEDLGNPEILRAIPDSAGLPTEVADR